MPTEQELDPRKVYQREVAEGLEAVRIGRLQVLRSYARDKDYTGEIDPPQYIDGLRKRIADYEKAVEAQRAFRP